MERWLVADLARVRPHKRDLWWSYGCIAYGIVCFIADNPRRELREFIHDTAILFLLSGAGGFVAVIVSAVLVYVNHGAMRGTWREYKRISEAELAQWNAEKQAKQK